MTSHMLEIVEKFADKNVVVIGDVMVDRYLYGKTTRISQEAPVPIVHYQDQEFRLGGAAHVALNLKMLGASVTLSGVYGEDAEGDWLEQILKKLGIENGCVQTDETDTIVKMRVISNGAQVCRIDWEKERENYNKIHDVKFLLDSGGQDAIFISDYDKGTVSFRLMEKVRESDVAFFCDPKSRNLEKYAGAAGITPNKLEVDQFLFEYIFDPDQFPDCPMFLEAVKAFGIESVLLTKGEDGVSFWEAGMDEPMCLPGHYKEIADSCGAGDTAFAVYGLSKTCGASTAEAAAMANLAASLVVEKQGVAPITLLSLVRALSGG